MNRYVFLIKLKTGLFLSILQWHSNYSCWPSLYRYRKFQLHGEKGWKGNCRTEGGNGTIHGRAGTCRLAHYKSYTVGVSISNCMGRVDVRIEQYRPSKRRECVAEGEELSSLQKKCNFFENGSVENEEYKFGGIKLAHVSNTIAYGSALHQPFAIFVDFCMNGAWFNFSKSLSVKQGSQEYGFHTVRLPIGFPSDQVIIFDQWEAEPCDVIRSDHEPCFWVIQ